MTGLYQRLKITSVSSKKLSVEVDWGLENGNSSPPNSHSTSEMYVSELEKDMQRFKNEIDMFQVELLALEKEN